MLLNVLYNLKKIFRKTTKAQQQDTEDAESCYIHIYKDTDNHWKYDMVYNEKSAADIESLIDMIIAMQYTKFSDTLLQSLKNSSENTDVKAGMQKLYDFKIQSLIGQNLINDELVVKPSEVLSINRYETDE